MKYSASAVLLLGVLMLGAWAVYWPPSPAVLPADGGRDVSQLTELTRAVAVGQQRQEALARGLGQLQQIAVNRRTEDDDLQAVNLIEPRPALSTADPRPATLTAARAGAGRDTAAALPGPAMARAAAGGDNTGQTSAAPGPALPRPPVLTSERIRERVTTRGGSVLNPMPVRPVEAVDGARAPAVNLAHLPPALYAYEVSMIYISPDRRYAVIDGLFRREGDVLTTGARVQRIHADGVELQYENENTARWIGLMAD